MSNENMTDIEWVFNPNGTRPGYSLNPFTGCLNQKDGLCLAGEFPCYAYKLAYGRVRKHYLKNLHYSCESMFDSGESICNSQARELMKAAKDPFYPRIWKERLEKHTAKENSPGRGIFLCDMSDWCGIGIPEDWSNYLLTVIRCNPQNRYYLLTKQPQNLYKFTPFPDNAWVGQTLTAGHNEFTNLYNKLYKFKDIQATVKFISFEPLLGNIDLPNFTHYLPMALKETGVSWVIIGACTGSKSSMMSLKAKYPKLTLMRFGSKWTAQPPLNWVSEIVYASDKAGVKVFLKDNLSPLLTNPRGLVKYPWACHGFVPGGDDYGVWCLRQDVPETK